MKFYQLQKTKAWNMSLLLQYVSYSWVVETLTFCFYIIYIKNLLLELILVMIILKIL
jgi:hypothetical protein